jgi:hypothetical protein
MEGDAASHRSPLLDEQFADRVCRVSGLTAALLGRAFQRVRWFAFHAALAGAPC